MNFSFDDKPLILKRLSLEYLKFENKSGLWLDIAEWIIHNQYMVIIILDGLDQSTWKQSPEFVCFNYEAHQKMKDLFLSNAKLIVTSRPQRLMAMPEILRSKMTFFVENLKFHDMKTPPYASAQCTTQELCGKVDIRFTKLLSGSLNFMMLQYCNQVFPCRSTSKSKSVTLVPIFATAVRNLNGENNTKNKLINKSEKQLIAVDFTMASTVVNIMEQLKRKNQEIGDVQDIILTDQSYRGHVSTAFNPYFSHLKFQEYFSAIYLYKKLSLLKRFNILETRSFTSSRLMVKKFASGFFNADIPTTG